MSARVTVVGVTSWGLTLALLYDRAGSTVTLLARNASEAETVRRHRTEPTRIAAIHLPDDVTITADATALRDAEIVTLAVPAQRMRENLPRIAPHLQPDATIVSAAKGIELSTGLRMSEVLAACLPSSPSACVLSGPNLAGEIARGLPASTVVAGPVPHAERVQAALNSSSFRVYTHGDVIGVELGGALKNVIALAAGMGDGLAYGENAKAALITRGLAEIARLGVALGAQQLTFAGLSGLGDLVATCASRQSRNHKIGEALGRGVPLADALAALDHVAEGVATTDAALTLARRHHVEMPITEGLARVLRGALTPEDGARLLMGRRPRAEMEVL